VAGVAARGLKVDALVFPGSERGFADGVAESILAWIVVGVGKVIEAVTLKDPGSLVEIDKALHRTQLAVKLDHGFLDFIVNRKELKGKLSEVSRWFLQKAS